MQITGVHIKNFKSIKELEFHPKTIIALIGGNNAGKSNILTAIERILGSKYPMINYFEPDDFYNRDESNKIEISLELIDKTNNPHNIFFGYKNGNRGENYYFEIDGSLEFQASEMGMGMQSSLTVALLRAYAEIKTNDSIIAIDEPEIFLHPQAQRSFYRIIRHLGKTGTQVFYTTHSNQFVDVEYFDALDYNVDRHGISIINAEGKGNLDRLYRIYNEFKIPTYIIMDGDSGKDKDGDSKRLTKEILEMLYLKSPLDYPTTTVADVFALFEVDYETSVRAEIPEYYTLELETRKLLGKKGDEGQGMVAKVVAENLIEKGLKEGDPKKYIPRTIQAIHAHIKEMKWHVSVLRRPANL
jgi:predicted ATP-dependent endonuclease of OLD family